MKNTMFKLGLIAWLFSFYNFSQAQTLVTIKPNDSKLASMQLEEVTLNKAIKKLEKIVLKSSWLKGSWSDSQAGYIFDRDKSSIGQDPEAEIVKEYFIPSNFTITIEDITIQENEKKAKKAAKDSLRDRLNSGENLTNKELNELLRN